MKRSNYFMSQIAIWLFIFTSIPGIAQFTTNLEVGGSAVIQSASDPGSSLSINHFPFGTVLDIVSPPARFFMEGNQVRNGGVLTSVFQGAAQTTAGWNNNGDDLGLVATLNPGGFAAAELGIFAEEFGAAIVRGLAFHQIVSLISTGAVTTNGFNHGYAAAINPSSFVTGAFYSSASGGVLLAGNEFGAGKIQMYSTASPFYGLVSTLSPNGSFNTAISSAAGNQERGGIALYAENNAAPAYATIDGSGMGNWIGHLKPFNMDHPENDDEEIWYAGIEGPEAGAYDRGKAKVVDGQAFVAYSDNFYRVIDPSTVTIILTSYSLDSYGLAVVDKSEYGFLVKELKHGKGNFDFDWEVKGKRKGFQSFVVERPRNSMTPEHGELLDTSAR